MGWQRKEKCNRHSAGTRWENARVKVVLHNVCNGGNWEYSNAVGAIGPQCQLCFTNQVPQHNKISGFTLQFIKTVKYCSCNYITRQLCGHSILMLGGKWIPERACYTKKQQQGYLLHKIAAHLPDYVWSSYLCRVTGQNLHYLQTYIQNNKELSRTVGCEALFYSMYLVYGQKFALWCYGYHCSYSTPYVDPTEPQQAPTTIGIYSSILNAHDVTIYIARPTASNNSASLPILNTKRQYTASDMTSKWGPLPGPGSTQLFVPSTVWILGGGG